MQSALPAKTQPADSLSLRYAHLGGSIEFLARFAPSTDKDEALIANPISCYEANAKGIPTIGIASQVRTLQRSTIVNWLVIQFLHTAEQFGSKDNITSQQLKQAAMDFLDLNPDLNPYEVMLYLRLLRAGKYGKVAYGQLAPNDLMAHTTTFRNQRDQELAVHYAEQKYKEEEERHQRMDTHGITYQQFIDLKARADNGDEEAKRLLREPAP